MWFNYTPTSGTVIFYKDKSGIDRTYSVNFIDPQKLVVVVAQLIHDNEVSEVTCMGLAYDLTSAIRQELLRTYNNESVKFIKGE